MGNFTPNTLVDDINVLMVHFPPWSTLCTAISNTKLFKTAKCTDQHTVIFVKVFSLIGVEKVVLKQKLDFVNGVISKIPQKHVICSAFLESESLGVLYRQFVYLSLRQRIIRPPFLNTEEKVWIGYLLLKSIQQLHEKNLMHGDVRPENFLLTSWDWVFLADLAFYKPLSIPEGDLTTYNLFFAAHKREACYLAPERFDSRTDKSQVGLPADIFALGCVLSEIHLEGEFLFTLSQILSLKKSDLKSSKFSSLPDAFQLLITKMICPNPDERWTIDECLNFYSEEVLCKSISTHFYDFCSDLLKKPNEDEKVKMVKQLIKSQKLEKDSIILFTILASCIRHVSVASLKIESASLMTRLPLCDEEKLHRVIPLLTSLLNKEEKTSVKCTALKLIPKVLSTIRVLTSKDIHLFKECIWPFVSLCKNDESNWVRYSLADLLPQYSQLSRKLLEIGRFHCKPTSNFDTELRVLSIMLVNTYKEMMETAEEEIRFKLLSNFPHFASPLSIDVTKGVFKEIIMPFVAKEHKQNESELEIDESAQIAILSESEKYIETLGGYFFFHMFRYLELNLFGKSEILVYLTLKTINLNIRSNFDLLEKTLPYLLHPGQWVREEMKKLIRQIIVQSDPTVNFLHVRPMMLPYLQLPEKKVFMVELDIIETHLLDHIRRGRFTKTLASRETYSDEDSHGALNSLMSMVRLAKGKIRQFSQIVMPEERIYYDENFSNDYFFNHGRRNVQAKMQFYEGIGLEGELDHVIESFGNSPVTHLLQVTENLVLSASKNGTIILWKLTQPDKYSKIKYKEKNETPNRPITISNCSDLVFVAYNTSIKVWDQEFSQIESEFTLENLTSACSISDSSLLISDITGGLFIRDLRENKTQKLFDLGAQKGIVSSSLKTPEECVALGTISGHVILFDLRFGAPVVSSCNSFKQPVLTMANYSCRYKPLIDGAQLVTGLSTEVLMWDLATLRPSVLFTKKTPVQVPYLSPDPFYYPEYTSPESSELLFDLDSSLKLEKLNLHEKISNNFVNGLTEFGALIKKSWETRSNVVKVVVPQESNLILSTGEDGVVHVWDPICIKNSTIIGYGGLVRPEYNSAILPDMLVVQEQSLPPQVCGVKKRDFDELNQSRKVSHSHTINDLLYLTEPKPLLLTGSNDATIRIWRNQRNVKIPYQSYSKLFNIYFTYYLMQALLKESTNSESINLEFCEIEELEPLIPILSKFPNLQDLNLFGNRLSHLPDSIGKLTKLKHLDISNNLFATIDSVAKGLKTLQNLENLHVTFTNNIDLDVIVSILPRLKMVNDNPISHSEDFSIKQEDLEKIALGYDEIRAIWRNMDENADKKLAADFDESIKTIMGELSEVAKSRCPGILLNAYMLKAKYELNFMCVDKIVGYSKVKLPETQMIFGTVLSEMLGIHQGIVKMLLNALESNLELVQEVQKLKSQVGPVTKEDLGKLQLVLNEKSEQIEIISKEKEELLEEIASLQEENKKYLETIIKRTKTNVEISSTKSQQPSPLPKQELKDLINFIYSSKSKLDTVQPEGLPKQTLSQHMFQSLAEKFKSRSKSIQKASEIVVSLKKYLDDVEVLLFTKILRTDCDENYRFLHEQVKDTIFEMVKEHSKTDEIKSKDWIEIVKFVYDAKDAEEMMKFIPLSKRSKSTINCVEFVNYILLFQLRAHEKYISRFNCLFRVVDKDGDGVISDEEFVRLCESFDLEIGMQDMNRFLEMVDPYGTQKITYSDCVAVFSTELVPGKSNPILQELT